MKPPKTRACFHCTHCHKQTVLWVSLQDYDAAEYACDHCGGPVWVGLEDLRDAGGQRLISHRPFDEPATEDEE